MELLVFFCVGLFFLVVIVLPRTRIGPYLENDGPLFGSWPDRKRWFARRSADKFGYADKQFRDATGLKADDIVPAASLTSQTFYWEQGAWPGWWRLWNEDRKNLALISDDFTWRVFTTYLWPSSHGYQLVEEDSLLAWGITTFDAAAWTPTIVGQAENLPEARRRAEESIKFIQGCL